MLKGQKKKTQYNMPGENAGGGGVLTCPHRKMHIINEVVKRMSRSNLRSKAMKKAMVTSGGSMVVPHAASNLSGWEQLSGQTGWLGGSWGHFHL